MEPQPSFKRELLAALPSLRAFAISLTGRHDRADDLVQRDTIVKAWAKQDHFEMGTNMKAWLFTAFCATNFTARCAKAVARCRTATACLPRSMATHPSQYGALDLQDFRKALDQLPADQREAIILVGASGFSYEEAAEICGCAVGTIKSRVNRARQRLRELLQISGEADFGPDATSAPLTSKAFAF